MPKPQTTGERGATKRSTLRCDLLIIRPKIMLILVAQRGTHKHVVTLSHRSESAFGPGGM